MSTKCDAKRQRELRGKFNGSTWTCPQGCCELTPVWVGTAQAWCLLWTPPGTAGFDTEPDDAQLAAIARDSVTAGSVD